MSVDTFLPLPVSMYLCFLSALPLDSLSLVQTSSLPLPSLHQSPSFSQTFLCFYPSSFPPEEDRAPLSLGSTNAREAFIIIVCVGKHACVCVSVYTLLIHSISGIPWQCCLLAAHHRPLKNRICNKWS